MSGQTKETNMKQPNLYRRSLQIAKDYAHAEGERAGVERCEEIARRAARYSRERRDIEDRSPAPDAPKRAERWAVRASEADEIATEIRSLLSPAAPAPKCANGGTCEGTGRVFIFPGDSVRGKPCPACGSVTP